MPLGLPRLMKQHDCLQCVSESARHLEVEINFDFNI